MDRVTKAKRSEIMSHIRGKDTKPEKVIFDRLEKLGIPFERHSKMLGSPDIVFREEKIAIFIDGDFWHGRDFEKRKLTLPKYWVQKIGRNMRRDRRYRTKLKKDGWVVARFWEYRVLKRPDGCIKRILKVLREHR